MLSQGASIPPSFSSTLLKQFPPPILSDPKPQSQGDSSLKFKQGTKRYSRWKKKKRRKKKKVWIKRRGNGIHCTNVGGISMSAEAQWSSVQASQAAGWKEQQPQQGTSILTRTRWKAGAKSICSTGDGASWRMPKLRHNNGIVLWFCFGMLWRQ